jgi:NADH-quinone oxidoreductase subunit A
MAWLWSEGVSPSQPGPSKNATYECGLESNDAFIGSGQVLSVARSSLIFDVKAIFLLHFAVAFTGLDGQRIGAMLIFLLF